MCILSREFFAEQAAKTILLNNEEIQTSHGTKNLETLTEMILQLSARELAESLLNDKEKFPTCYGQKNLETLTSFINEMIDVL